MITTRIAATVSSLEIAPVRGLNNPNNATNVKTTAMWARILFSFFIPVVHRNKITPIKVGISAVIDGVSEVKYAHNGKRIKIIELIKLALTVVTAL